MVLPKPQIFFQDKRPRIFRSLLALFFIILTVLLFEGAYFYFKPKEKNQSLVSNETETTRQQKSVPVFGEKTTSFQGKVREKGDNFLLLDGEVGQTIRVLVNDQTIFQHISQVGKKGENFEFKDIKKNDVITILGKDKGDFLEAIGGIIL